MADPEMTQYLQSLGLPTQNLPVQPGLQSWQLIIEMAIQKYMADLQQKQAQQQMEIQLQSSPGSFVGYELYKKQLEQSGKTPFTGPSLSHQKIQQAYNQALGFGPGVRSEKEFGGAKPGHPAADPRVSIPGGGAYQPPQRTQMGYGHFGVPIYNPGEIGRNDLMNMSQGEQELLGSFLRAGVDTGGGKFMQIDPTDYMDQVKKGFIPSMSEAGPQMQYS